MITILFCLFPWVRFTPDLLFHFPLLKFLRWGTAENMERVFQLQMPRSVKEKWDVLLHKLLCWGAAFSVSETREGGPGVRWAERGRKASVLASWEGNINAIWEHVGYPELLPGKGYPETTEGWGFSLVLMTGQVQLSDRCGWLPDCSHWRALRKWDGFFSPKPTRFPSSADALLTGMRLESC